MRLLTTIISIWLLSSSTLGQTVRVLDITEENASFFNFVLNPDERLVINFLVDPLSLTFVSSPIREIPEGTFSNPSLLRFAAMACQISEISSDEFTGASNLTYLDLSSNFLEVITNEVFARAPKITHLNLSNNRITHLDDLAFAGLDELTNLSLYINQLIEINSVVFAQVPTLKWLDLGYNELSTLPFGALPTLLELEILWLEYNHFEEFNIRTLISSVKLENIYLHGNHLEALNVRNVEFILPNLTQISLNRNNWSCAALSETITNLRMHNVSLFNAGENVANNPVMLEGIACTDENDAE